MAKNPDGERPAFWETGFKASNRVQKQAKLLAHLGLTDTAGWAPGAQPHCIGGPGSGTRPGEAGRGARGLPSEVQPRRLKTTIANRHETTGAALAVAARLNPS